MNRPAISTGPALSIVSEIVRTDGSSPSPTLSRARSARSAFDEYLPSARKGRASTRPSATATRPRMGTIMAISTSATHPPLGMLRDTDEGSRVGNRTHNATIPEQTANALAEYAARVGTAPATVIREIVEEYSKGEPEKLAKPAKATRVKYRADEETFSKAIARATAENRSLSAAITAKVEELLAA